MDVLAGSCLGRQFFYHYRLLLQQHSSGIVRGRSHLGCLKARAICRHSLVTSPSHIFFLTSFGYSFSLHCRGERSSHLSNSSKHYTWDNSSVMVLRYPPTRITLSVVDVHESFQ